MHNTKVVRCGCKGCALARKEGAADMAQRVRELPKKWTDDGMACGCFDVAIADLTEALEGEQ